MLKTRTRWTVALVLAIMVLIGSLYGLVRFGLGIDILDRSGWHTKHGVTRYLDYFGRPKTGWQYIDGNLYYFEKDGGYMVTGWQQLGEGRYYFGDDGVRATGWQTIDGKSYYLGDSGKRVTGWQQIDGKHYLFTQEGAMATGWQTVNDRRCYFSQDGMALTGWQHVDGKLYYFTADGYTVAGWQTLDNVRYHFEEDGAVSTGWFRDDTGEFFFDQDGRPYNGWLDWEQKRYYFKDGTVATGWLTEGEDLYYLKDDGSVTVGEAKIDGKTYFFTSKGKSVLLCNRNNPVPADYELKLASIDGFQFDSSGRDALQKMMEDCRQAGNYCTINNTYRSKATQQWMWNKSVKKYMDAGMTREQANKETAKDTMLPGHSEHQTGLAVDVNGTDATYKWLAENCWDYGFILRYPADKIDITGIIHEPWHFRYVGTELSLELEELGLCMEEYMTMLTEKNG